MPEAAGADRGQVVRDVRDTFLFWESREEPLGRVIRRKLLTIMFHFPPTEEKRSEQTERRALERSGPHRVQNNELGGIIVDSIREYG